MKKPKEAIDNEWTLPFNAGHSGHEKRMLTMPFLLLLAMMQFLLSFFMPKAEIRFAGCISAARRGIGPVIIGV
ncbi:hypothetical protein AC578_5310 [Pseudocercospora eumusae]|uniref:Uncharacterized protein n=1 Tax=Pseudocercospora eumusae TaxID=321146 RepID=A0A139H015_9PEZI|nr:hypothetical protein AC578_5310 [Pseudocercospora eumusae]